MHASELPTKQPASASSSTDELFAQVYARLKAMAATQLASRGRPTALDTTELVHELYLRMDRQDDLHFQHPAQFFAYAARAMRHLLTDRARDHLRQRAGGGWLPITLSGSDSRLALSDATQALAMDDALTQLEAIDARAARVVELRYFAGLSLQQTGEQLGITRRTADRDWAFARAFLHDLLG